MSKLKITRCKGAVETDYCKLIHAAKYMSKL